MDGYSPIEHAGARKLEQRYSDVFGQAVSAVRQSGEALSLPDGAKEDIMIALEICKQEMKLAGDLDDFVGECAVLQEHLRAEWFPEPSEQQRVGMEMGM